MPIKKDNKKRSKLKQKLIHRAREFRKEATPAEVMLWERIRGKRLAGIRFRRQHIIPPFVVDFYCSKVNLVIEIDGSIHDLQQERDKEREEDLERQGHHIIRFTNDEVIQNIDNVLHQIIQKISSLKR